MSVKTLDELLKGIHAKYEEDTTDETLAFLEDVTDTFNDMKSKIEDTTDWKNKYEENDKEWRQKYKDRFFNSDVEEPDDIEDDEPTIMRFEDLFKSKGDK